MRVGLSQGGQSVAGEERPDGSEVGDRYLEMIDEVRLAERVGFDFYGVGEQHFASSNARTSSPEVFLAHLAAVTERIRLRTMSINLLPFNHPIRVLEQVATLDVVSRGRFELGCARSNNAVTLKMFGIPADSTRESRDEMLQMFASVWAKHDLAFEGGRYHFPSASMAPWPVQRPHPPVFLSVTSTESARWAGEAGIGAMIGFTISWTHLEACIAAYRSAAEAGRGIFTKPTRSAGAFSAIVMCSRDASKALEIARDQVVRWFQIVARMYAALSPQSPDYEYLAKMAELSEHLDDVEYLEPRMPYLMIGTPDHIIDKVRHIRSLGADEVIWDIDGMGHENHMSALELLGEEVLPVVRSL